MADRFIIPNVGNVVVLKDGSMGEVVSIERKCFCIVRFEDSTERKVSYHDLVSIWSEGDEGVLGLREIRY